MIPPSWQAHFSHQRSTKITRQHFPIPTASTPATPTSTDNISPRNTSTSSVLRKNLHKIFEEPQYQEINTLQERPRLMGLKPQDPLKQEQKNHERQPTVDLTPKIFTPTLPNSGLTSTLKANLDFNAQSRI